MLKAMTYALISCALLNLLAPFVHGQGFVLVRDALAPAAFTIFSVSLAAGLCQLRPLAIIIAIAACLGAYPSGMEELARLLIPVGSGMLLGHSWRLCLPPTRLEQRP